VRACSTRRCSCSVPEVEALSMWAACSSPASSCMQSCVLVAWLGFCCWFAGLVDDFLACLAC
jgi:hypothetical protein